MSNEEPLSGTLNLTIQDLNHKIDAIYRHGLLQEDISVRFTTTVRAI